MATDKKKAERRLSGVIRQDAAASGVANLVGANEIAGGAMKQEIAQLRAEVEEKGLSGEVKASGSMSLKAEIKMLKAVLEQSPSTAIVEEEEEEEDVVQDVTEDDDDDDEVPELEEVQEEVVQPTQEQAMQSRGEKKSRKAMAKLGLVPVAGINRVTMKKGSGRSGAIIVFNSPDVFKSPTSSTYIIFGEAKIEDAKDSPVQQAANQYKQSAQQDQFRQPPQVPASDDTGDVDESGVDPKDIDLVVGQAGCTRGQAVVALKNNDNDIVNAIMELTM